MGDSALDLYAIRQEAEIAMGEINALPFPVTDQMRRQKMLLSRKISIASDLIIMLHREHAEHKRQYEPWP